MYKWGFFRRRQQREISLRSITCRSAEWGKNVTKISLPLINAPRKSFSTSVLGRQHSQNFSQYGKVWKCEFTVWPLGQILCEVKKTISIACHRVFLHLGGDGFLHWDLHPRTTSSVYRFNPLRPFSPPEEVSTCRKRLRLVYLS